MHDGPMIGGFPPCVACAGAGSFQPTREGLFCKWRGSLRGGFAGDNSVGGIGLRVWPTQELARSTARVNGSSANDRPRKGGLAARAPGEIPTDGFPL